MVCGFFGLMLQMTPDAVHPVVSRTNGHQKQDDFASISNSSLSTPGKIQVASSLNTCQDFHDDAVWVQLSVHVVNQ